MATPGRGLARERHTGTKAMAAVAAVGGFVAAWLGFVNSHGSASAGDPTAVATAIASAEPTVTPVATASGSTEPTVTPVPTDVPRSRISRGS